MHWSIPTSSGAHQGAIQSQQFNTVTGQQAYTQAQIGVTNLVGATIIGVYYAGQLLRTDKYSFNSATGTLTFITIVNTGAYATIQYTLSS